MWYSINSNGNRLLSLTDSYLDIIFLYLCWFISPQLPPSPNLDKVKQSLSAHLANLQLTCTPETRVAKKVYSKVCSFQVSLTLCHIITFFRIRSHDFINLKVLITYIWHFKRTRMEKYVAFKMVLVVVLPKQKKKKKLAWENSIQLTK